MDNRPNLNLKQMRAIQWVARYSSFVAASVEMRMSQPGISRLIRSAEEELGVELFYRSTRQVLMTHAGLQVLPVIDRILAEFDLAAEELPQLRANHQGHVTVGCPVSIAHRLLAEVVAQYRRKHPEVTLEIREALKSEVINQIRFGVVDFGLASFMEADDDLAVEQLCELSYYVAAPRTHPFAGRKSVSLDELKGQPLVSLPPSSIIRRIFDEAAAKEGYSLKHEITVNSPISIFSLIENGAGVSIMNGASVRSYPSKDIVICRLCPPHITSSIFLVRLKGRMMNPAASSFMEDVARFFKETDLSAYS
jgi:DNA-binding transcriptional LysR family regulator